MEDEIKIVEIEGEIVSLIEKAVRADNTGTIKVIAPGWGSSGYYGEDMLQRDGPAVFKAGTKMFWDHATAQEGSSRPEGSLDLLAGELVTDAVWHEKGTDGPGLYADSKVFGRFKDAVNELAPHIGVSIRARGKSEAGEAEGREGAIISEISQVQSIDFVTRPGAGGKVIPLCESYREAELEPVTPPAPEESIMTKEEIQALEAQLAEWREQAETATKENAALKTAIVAQEAAVVAQEAAVVVSETLKASTLPEPSQKRLTEVLRQGDPPLTEDGKLDVAKYTEAIKLMSQEETAYLTSVTESTGQVQGLGASTPPDSGETFNESLAYMFMQAGKTKEEAEQLAKLAGR